jgi:actin-related protein 5
VTGGNTLTPHFDARLHSSIRSVLPVGTPINVVRPADVRLDAWRGLAKWAGSEEFASAQISRQDYMEMGGEYIKEHRLSNAYKRLVV